MNTKIAKRTGNGKSQARALCAVIQRLEREVQELREEIQRMKGTTQRPKIAPRRLLKPPLTPDPKGKRPGSAKRSKTKELKIDETFVLELEGLPPDARCEGYRDFVVQDLIVQSHTTRYRRAVDRWADGTLRVAARPAGLTSHFGVALKPYILLQVHQNHVPQGRLWEELQERGINLSAGQISNMLLAGHDDFHAEKDELLPMAREISDHLHGDDTSARHQGKPAVCTHIGNELFASFTTTDSQSRLNFLRLLCQPQEQYRWCEEAQQSLEWRGAGKKLVLRLYLPLHNNLAENDIREYARLRKISAGTRSDLGRRCRDTFLSLKKTCRKLGISFAADLHDRLSGTRLIERLGEQMRKAIAPEPTLTPSTTTPSG